ncbi:MAG TPA: alpha/beta hydrolase, partial [Burkholderiaceae bacterium]|nr:alpha/beta hydrolase [Burkholderiaceae bacterium]
MRPGTRTVEIAGAAGAIDVAIDLPAQPARAVAVVAHPHPLFGGTRDNKVVQT